MKLNVVNIFSGAWEYSDQSHKCQILGSPKKHRAECSNSATASKESVSYTYKRLNFKNQEALTIFTRTILLLQSNGCWFFWVGKGCRSRGFGNFPQKRSNYGSTALTSFLSGPHACNQYQCNHHHKNTKRSIRWESITLFIYAWRSQFQRSEIPLHFIKWLKSITSCTIWSSGISQYWSFKEEAKTIKKILNTKNKQVWCNKEYLDSKTFHIYIGKEFGRIGHWAFLEILKVKKQWTIRKLKIFHNVSP